MPPDTLDAVRMDEVCLTVHELPGMTDGPVIHESVISPVFVREDHGLDVGMVLDQRNEGISSAVCDHLDETLTSLAGDTTTYPCPRHRGFIPFGTSRQHLRFEPAYEQAQRSIETLRCLAIDTEDASQILPGHASTRREEANNKLPLTVAQMTAALRRVRASSEDLAAVRTFEALTISTIHSISMGSGGPAEAAENSMSGHKWGERG